MTLQIYNTLTRAKEEFRPQHPPKVSMYVCGVTVYDYCHLGHARALINFDVIARYLAYKKYEVNFVRNFTDVDDKIIARAVKENLSWQTVTQKYIQAFQDDATALHLKHPTVEPKATDHIQDMQNLIAGLMQKGLAYEANGDVFYSVRKKADYGKLSGKKIEELESGARIEVDESKKDPLDFALWKSAKPNEPSWDSPWGKGRPGWHIECSAMSIKYLGETFDIHGGGRDLSFPHHENEIAQSEGFTGKPFALTWIHNGFVTVNAEKMSKSVGNFLTIRELLTQYSAEVVRAFVLAAHYRSPIDYSEELLQSIRQSLDRWYTTIERYEQAAQTAFKSKGDSPELNERLQKLLPDFENAMDDDFNTAKVFAILFDLATALNRALDTKLVNPSGVLTELNQKLSVIHEVLGVFGSSSASYFSEETERRLKALGLTREAIQTKVDARLLAKQQKDFQIADRLRDELLQLGVQIKDAPDGSCKWNACR